jgi:hypothetical protein
LFFDEFPTAARAEEFARAAAERFGRKTAVWDDQDAMSDACVAWVRGESDVLADIFPWELVPPIVLVERNASLDGEREIKGFAKQYGGTYAGT